MSRRYTDEYEDCDNCTYDEEYIAWRDSEPRAWSSPCRDRSLASTKKVGMRQCFKSHPIPLEELKG